MKLPLLGKTVADFCEQVADPFDQSLVLIETFALLGVVSYHHKGQGLNYSNPSLD